MNPKPKINYSLILLMCIGILSAPLLSQNIISDGRTYTPNEGRQMASAYGYVSVVQGIVTKTTTQCSQWIPHYKNMFNIIYSLWLKRNQAYFDKNKSIFQDLVQLVAQASHKKKSAIALFYREMTNTAIKRFMTILLRKEYTSRTQFCHEFSARIASGTLDINFHKKISLFIQQYQSL